MNYLISEKLWVGWWGGWVACRIIVSAPVPVPFLFLLDLRFETWAVVGLLEN